jgi:hypothetical protein
MLRGFVMAGRLVESLLDQWYQNSAQKKTLWTWGPKWVIVQALNLEYSIEIEWSRSWQMCPIEGDSWAHHLMASKIAQNATAR